MSRRRRVRVTPLGYIVLGIIILIMVIGIFFIVWSMRGESSGKQQEPEDTPGLEITPTPALPPVNGEVTFTGQDPGGGGNVLQGTVTIPPDITPSPTMKPVDTPEPQVQTPSPDQITKAVDGKTTAKVRLRSGPGTQYSVKGTYVSGTRLKIYSREGDFYFVMVLSASSDPYGYMSVEYVEKSGLLPGETATPVPKAPNGAINGTVKAKEMNLRAGPSTDSRQVGHLSHGEHVYIYFKTGKFYYIQVVSSGLKCYGFAEYISAEKTVPSGTPVP